MPHDSAPIDLATCPPFAPSANFQVSGPAQTAVIQALGEAMAACRDELRRPAVTTSVLQYLVDRCEWYRAYGLVLSESRRQRALAVDEAWAAQHMLDLWTILLKGETMMWQDEHMPGSRGHRDKGMGWTRRWGV